MSKRKNLEKALTGAVSKVLSKFRADDGDHGDDSLSDHDLDDFEKAPRAKKRLGQIMVLHNSRLQVSTRKWFRKHKAYQSQTLL